jgi:nitrite reductase (NADH) small subunit
MSEPTSKGQCGDRSDTHARNRTGRVNRKAHTILTSHNQPVRSNSPALPCRFMSEFQTVAKVGDIAEGQGITVAFGDRLIAVFNSEGKFFAIDDICPHMGASLGAGAVEDGIVTCPWHAWRFKVCDGTWCDNPRLKVDSFEVRVVGERYRSGDRGQGTSRRDQGTGVRGQGRTKISAVQCNGQSLVLAAI